MTTLQLVLAVICSWFLANLLGLLFVWLADGKKALGFTLGFMAVGCLWAVVWLWQMPAHEIISMVSWGV